MSIRPKVLPGIFLMSLTMLTACTNLPTAVMIDSAEGGCAKHEPHIHSRAKNALDDRLRTEEECSNSDE